MVSFVGNRQAKDASLFSAQVLDDDPTEAESAEVDVSDYLYFGLYLRMQSASTPTTLQVIPQFKVGSVWYSYLQGIFASLIFEDTVMATEIQRAYRGEVAGDTFRLRIVGAGTTAAATFTVTADARFFR